MSEQQEAQAPQENDNSATLGMFASASGQTGSNFTPLDLDELFKDYYLDTTLPDDALSSNVQIAGKRKAPEEEFTPDMSMFENDEQPVDPTEATVSTASSAVPVQSMPSIHPIDSAAATTASSKTLTAAQKIERRERNREHAKRSRLRKKFLLESLQDQILGLQTEIEDLQGIIRRELPNKAEALLADIDAAKKGGIKKKYTPLPMPSGFGPVKTLIEPDYRLMSSLSGSQQNFAISDPSLPDNPIVYVSQGFLDLTGYTLDQVLGRNCRFLQGPGTDQSAVDIIRKGVRDGVDTSVCLLNYKADGTPFWNQFFVAALRDAEGNVVNFVGVQCEVSKATIESQKNKK